MINKNALCCGAVDYCSQASYDDVSYTGGGNRTIRLPPTDTPRPFTALCSTCQCFKTGACVRVRACVRMCTCVSPNRSASSRWNLFIHNIHRRHIYPAFCVAPAAGVQGTTQDYDAWKYSHRNSPRVTVFRWTSFYLYAILKILQLFYTDKF